MRRKRLGDYPAEIVSAVKYISSSGHSCQVYAKPEHISAIGELAHSELQFTSKGRKSGYCRYKVKKQAPSQYSGSP